MTVKKWILILLIEIVTVLLVMLNFYWMDRQWAGVAGGVLFILMCTFISFRLHRSHSLGRNLTTYGLGIFLFGAVLPIFITRIMYWNSDFRDLKVLGIPAETFHHLSSMLFMVLFVTTLFDFVLSIINRRA